MARRAQAHRIQWPLTPLQVEHIDEMLQSLFDDTNNGRLKIRASQIQIGIISAAQGGTGFSSYTVGDMLYADTTTTLAKLADVATGNAIISGGVGVAPSYGKIGLTTHVSGILAAPNGGTGFGTYAIGDLLYASTTGALAQLADVSAGSYLRSGGVSTAPVWSTVKIPNTASIGDLWQGTSSNTLTALASVSAGSYLRSGGVTTASVWSTVKIPNTATTGDLWQGTAANTISALASVAAGSYLRSGGVATASVWSTVTIPNTATIGDLWQGTASNVISALASVAAGSYLRSGGVATASVWSTLTLPNAASQGDIFVAAAANAMSVLAKDTNATRYVSNTGASNQPAWAQVALATGVSGTLPVGNGGTGATTFTANGVLYGNTTGAIQVTAEGATGTALVGTTGAAPSYSAAVTLNTSLTTPKHIGGTGTTSTITIQATSGNATTGADVIFAGGNNGATELARLLSTGLLGINVAAPAAYVDVESVDATSSTALQFTRATAGVGAPLVRGRKSRGTAASRTKALNGDNLFSFQGEGYQETSSAFIATTSIIYRALEDYTSTAGGSSMLFLVTPVGSVTPATQMTIKSSAWSVGSMVTPAASGQRYLQIDTAGVITSSATAPVGT